MEAIEAPPNTLTARIKHVIACEEVLATAESQLADCKNMLAEAEADVIAAFEADPEQGAVVYAGRTWRREVKTRLSPAKGMTNLVVEWIKSNGGEDLVKPTMHPQTRDAFLRDQLINDDGDVNIPAELVELVTVFDQPILTRRKAGA